jgi:phytoene synthase
VSELDPDRALALTYVPAARREALRALWRLDAALGAVLAGGREPLISQIKLAWWRDSLEKLDHSKPPAEPVLEAVATHVLPSGVSGSALSEMEAGWTTLLSQEPLTPGEIHDYATARGGLLFRYAGLIMGATTTAEMERGGEGWALVDLARHSNPADAEAALAAARERFAEAEKLRWPSALRPLGMLARLASRDALRPLAELEPHGAPARMWAMLSHRLTGL